MAPTPSDEFETRQATLNRRAMITASMATGVATLGHQSAVAQSTPSAASPVAGADIDTDKLMMLSANLCGGAILNPDLVVGLAALLANEENATSTLEELQAVEWFTPESLAETSPEAQAVAKNILQYWFLGQYNGELVENRTELYIELATWQSLPYMTQQGACKGENYWAEEVTLEPTGE